MLEALHSFTSFGPLSALVLVLERSRLWPVSQGYQFCPGRSPHLTVGS
jgi:hypothetical protein